MVVGSSTQASRQRAPQEIATILLDSGLVPIDQLQKFLGHLDLSTTQIYAETSLRALGDNYIRALGGMR
jgi:integrase/recombinase XerD